MILRIHFGSSWDKSPAQNPTRPHRHHSRCKVGRRGWRFVGSTWQRSGVRTRPPLMWGRGGPLTRSVVSWDRGSRTRPPPSVGPWGVHSPAMWDRGSWEWTLDNRGPFTHSVEWRTEGVDSGEQRSTHPLQFPLGNRGSRGHARGAGWWARPSPAPGRVLGKVLPCPNATKGNRNCGTIT